MHRSETHILGERVGLKEVDGGAAMVHVQRVEIIDEPRSSWRREAHLAFEGRHCLI